jgi:lipopolysaccharide assembly outer membrane protein LptD (OstA)
LIGRILITICLLAAILLGAGQTAAQGRARGHGTNEALADSTVYRVQAETYRLRLENGVEVSYLDGKVRIDHQTAWITSDNGKDFRSDRHTLLIGNVHGHDGTMEMYGKTGEYFGFTNTMVIEQDVRILDDGMEIICDRASYDRDRAVVILTGHVRMSDETRVMYADSIYYDRNTEIADATGQVVLIDQIEDYSISGRHAKFFRNTKEAVMDEDPVLVFDDRSEEQGRVVSRLMHFNMDSATGIAVGDVRMVKGETRSTCDSAVIHNDEEYMELFGDPYARSGSAGMSGERAVLYYNEQGVERVVLPGGGRLTDAPSHGSPWREDSWLDGDSLIIYMSDDEVDSVKVFGGAKAMYYPYEGDERKVSNNYSSGDSMYFRFVGSDLSYVRISGKSEGVYNYVNLQPGETIDSLSSVIDSSLSYKSFSTSAERVVYKAKQIEYFAEVEDIVLHGESILDYQNKSLKADHIKFNSRLNILDAEGNPVLEESGQEMFGTSMGYDMDSEGGLVVGGSTHYDTGYFRGEHIFKDGDKILKVYNSTYTTCDLKHPHYSMRAGKMKIYIGDKIISGPIRLYIGEIPVFYLPFLANSLRRDRHSGLLRPNFDVGINSRDGRFIRGLGYYWATNDYTDFIFKTDFNENLNFRFQVNNRYKLRYSMDGNINFNYFRNFRTNANEWTIKAKHNQKFGRKASLSADLRFVSSDEAQSSVYSAEDVQRIIDRRIYSTASFRKSWGGTSLSLSARRDQKLNVGEDNPYENRISMTIPSLSLNLPRTSLWFGEKHKEAERGKLEKGLRSITIAPNLKGTITTEESVARKKGKISASSGASFSQQHKLMFLNLSPRVSLNWNYNDILYDKINENLVVDAGPAVITGNVVTVPLYIDGTNNNLQIEVDGVTGPVITIPDQNCLSSFDLSSLAVSIGDALATAGQTVDVTFVEAGADSGYFSFSSSGYGTSTSLRLDDPGNTIYTTLGMMNGDYTTGTNMTGPVVDTAYKNEVGMSFSTGVGTSLYGTFYANVGPLRGIRHTFNPTVNYSYTPKLTANQIERQSVTYSIRNVIDLKYLKNGQEAKKNNAISWDMSGSYNPKADRDQRFSTIRSNISTALGRIVSLRLNHTVDPYEWKFLSTNFSLNMNRDFRGSFKYDSAWSPPEQEKIAAARDREDKVPEQELAAGADGMAGARGVFDDGELETGMEDSSGEGMPGGNGEMDGIPSWTIHTGFSFSTNYGENLRRTMSSKIDINGTLNLTKNWKLRYTAYYDPESRKFTNQVYTIHRDLHCWEAEFTHSRFASDWGFYFRIRIKDLPDIFHEVGRRGLSGMRGF